MGAITNTEIIEGSKVSLIEGTVYNLLTRQEGYDSKEIADKIGRNVVDVYEPLCRLKDSGLIKPVSMFGTVRYFINRNSKISVNNETGNVYRRKSEINFVGIRPFCNAVASSTKTVFSEPFLKKLKSFVNEPDKIIVLIPDGVALVETFSMSKETGKEEKALALTCIHDKKLLGHILGFVK